MGPLAILKSPLPSGTTQGMSRSTKTRTFGSSRREGHDSSPFYHQKLYAGRPSAPVTRQPENAVPGAFLDKILRMDARKMEGLPDRSIHLMVTSPPYNVGKDYDRDLDLGEYRALLKDVFGETYRVLVDGGRACVNIANVGRKPYIPYHRFIIDAMEEIGFLMRGEVIWDKGAGAGVSTAWGSWRSPSNPTFRDVHEYILVFSKGQFGRRVEGGKASITSEQFVAWTKSIWSFSPESATRVGHPAPFPVELPSRLIRLFTYEGEVVLDPFCGVGTTCVAAATLNRHYVGMDLVEDYVQAARERIRRALSSGNSADSAPPRAPLRKKRAEGIPVDDTRER